MNPCQAEVPAMGLIDVEDGEGKAIAKNVINHIVVSCGVEDHEKPMVFRGKPWCSDDHRKAVTGAAN